MAELIRQKPKSKSTTNCFLGCFGLPSKQKLSRKKSDSKKKKTTTALCFSRSILRIKRSSSIKTVPLDSTNESSEGINLSFTYPNPIKDKDEEPKSLGQITTAATVSSDNQSPKETKINSLQQNRMQSDDAATCQKGLSFLRKIDSIRASSHQSSVDTAWPKAIRSNMVISRSTTFPVPGRVKLLGSPSNQTQRQHFLNTTLRQWTESRKVEGNKLVPPVGMSIVVVTLFIMLVWGRLCAILTTSAWFYFVPRLRSKIDQSGIKSGSEQPDMNSKECKKRVVLEGLLDRNNRRQRIRSTS